MKELSFTQMKQYLTTESMREHLLCICNLYSTKTPPYTVALHFTMGQSVYHVLTSISLLGMQISKLVGCTYDKQNADAFYHTYRPEESDEPIAISAREHHRMLHDIKHETDIQLHMGEVAYTDFS